MNRDFSPPKAVFSARNRMYAAIRRFFDARDFTEVETPIAVFSPGIEPHLEAFKVTEIGPDRKESTLYLHTSPEYAMKKLLARKIAPIYQIARVFRNGERSRTHAPEFTLLEWYRSPGSLENIMDDLEAVIADVADAVDGPWKPRSFERLSVSEAFERAGLRDPIACKSKDELEAAMGVRTVSDDTWEDIFHRAFFEKIEPTFASDTLTIVHGYPAKMAALARIDQKRPECAERFELYVGHLELANAFGELSDPVEQRLRFEADLKERRAKNRDLYPIDEGLLRELEAMGEAAGIALGLDRLLMLCLGAKQVQDVIAFSPRD